MTAMNRRAKIEAMLKDDPNDRFLRYSLAMEMACEEDFEGSLQQVSSLLTEEPPYVPAFFLSGRHLVALGRVEEARTMLREGIDHARQQNDSHAAAEMSELLMTLGNAGE